METYLFKFSACLAIFWLVYILFLERQSMHRFKRFYLLGTLALAITIPMVTITEYIDPVVTTFKTGPQFIPIEPFFIEMPIEEDPFFDLETTLWLIYGLGVLLFAFRFIINLAQMQGRISKNKNISKRSFIYVLLKEKLIPHSFFRYIFLNKERYESNDIPKEVMLHEETHAKQLHSLDIIILELLQVIFWFHPLIYILKHHIKMNHEFLADQAVLKQGSDTKTYQTILLQFSSNTQHHQLSSAINYSSIKKRFTVMKTQTSKTRIWLSTILVLPIIALLFYNFAERVEVIKEAENTSEIRSIQSSKIISIAINNSNQFLINNEPGNLTSLEALLKTLPITESYDLDFKSDKGTSLVVYFETMVLLKKYNILNTAHTPDWEKAEEWLRYASVHEFQDYTEKYKKYEALRTGKPHYIHKTAEQQKQMDDLFSELGGLYFRMSKEDKAKVERPISPTKPYVQITLHGKTYYKKYDELSAEEKATFPPPPPLPPAPTTLPEPPTPPTPIKNPSFLAFIQDMGKQGASFYLDDKKISAKEANSFATNNKGKSTEMLTQLDDNGKYIVKLSSPRENKNLDKAVAIIKEQKQQQTEKILPIVNGQTLKTGELSMTISELKKLILTLPNGGVIAFKLKIPGIKTQQIKGNTISNEAINKLNSAKTGDVITIFDIKADNSSEIPPLIIEVLKPYQHLEQESILPIVNAKTIKRGDLRMTLNEIKKLTLTLPNGEVTAFKFKIPGVNTLFIKGNTLSKEVLENLGSAKEGDVVSIFDIKADNSTKISPVIIEIVK